MPVFVKNNLLGVEVGCTQKSPTKIAPDSLLSGEVSFLKVGSFSFGSPVSDSTVSKPIFYIKATEDNTNISTPMLYLSGMEIFPHHLRAIQSKRL